MVLSDKIKHATIKDAAQAVGISVQAVSRVMNKFSYVSGKTLHHVRSVVEQCKIPESAYFRPSRTTISLYLQIPGGQVAPSIMETIQSW